ncbi:MAG: hypothetical protein HUU37_09360 [Bdellovibrionales bacterium]|nr:hypothetical protein [Bdellovibrionales bacterium]
MKKNHKQNRNSDFSLAHVLYQKLGDNWYAFTELDGDCYMSRVDDAAVEAHMAQRQEERNSSATRRKMLRAA